MSDTVAFCICWDQPTPDYGGIAAEVNRLAENVGLRRFRRRIIVANKWAADQPDGLRDAADGFERQLDEADASVVVALGGHASWALSRRTPERKRNKSRIGQWFLNRGRTPVMPTRRPDSWADKSKYMVEAVRDFREVAAHMGVGQSPRHRGGWTARVENVRKWAGRVRRVVAEGRLEYPLCPGYSKEAARLRSELVALTAAGQAPHLDHRVPISWFVRHGHDPRLAHDARNLQFIPESENADKADALLAKYAKLAESLVCREPER